MIGVQNYPWESWLQKWFIWLLIPAIIVNISGCWIPILEPDGALYATIAKTIAQTGDFVNLMVEGRDWLDKPHFPFWITALSFRMLGINAFAYKLPALLFWGMGAWYTWKLALSLYGKPVAQLSVLIYVSAAHLVISNNDVRAEPYMTGLIIGAVYHLYKASRVKPGLHLVVGSFLTACALMTKGPYLLITIGAGFIIDWIVGKEWEQFRNIRWYLALLLIIIFTFPELYCLYVQFDRHPEKLVYGNTHVSGIRFFFWDSQFGRFFNTGPIKGSGDPFFYFHTLLWAFLPWSLLLYAAIIQKCRDLRKQSVPGDKICLGAVLVSFVIFSLSRFQLPHYLNILFPFFAILTAGYLYNIRRKPIQKAVRITQGIINILLPILLIFLCWFFHFAYWPALIIVFAGLAILPFLLFKEKEIFTSIARSFFLSMLVFAFINFVLYPAILQYQSGTQAGKYIATLPKTPDTDSIYMVSGAPASYSFEFYCPQPIRFLTPKEVPALINNKSALFFTKSNFADTLQKEGCTIEKIRVFPNFHISQLTGPFLYYKTRASRLEEYDLLRVGK